MKHFTTPIISNLPICDSYYQLTFRWPGHAGAPRPGQFATIRVSHGTAPLLRRPFAFSGVSASEGVASVIYQKRGDATRLLAGMAAGEALDVLGPLGNSFSVPAEGTRAVLLAGGIGLGPVLFHARQLQQQRGDCLFIFGCRTKTGVPQNAEFRLADPRICTDDGTDGYHGTVVDYLRATGLDRRAKVRLFCCGPTPMLKAAHLLAQAMGWECEVSVEQVMACGVGACMGCVVKVHGGSGYARACTEGPVFPSRDVQWT